MFVTGINVKRTGDRGAQISTTNSRLSFGRSCFRFAPLFISSPPYTIDRYSPTPYKCGTPTNRRSLTTLDEAVNEHVSAARPESGGKWIYRWPVDRSSERNEEGKKVWSTRAVRRAATADYIYAYLMRVHNARERRNDASLEGKIAAVVGGRGQATGCFSSPRIRPNSAVGTLTFSSSSSSSR